MITLKAYNYKERTSITKMPIDFPQDFKLVWENEAFISQCPLSKHAPKVNINKVK